MVGTAGRAWLLALCLSGAACGSRPAPITLFTEQDGRSVVAPLRLGWLSSERTTDALPTAIELGGKTSGRVLLYFEFPELEASRRLLQAQLLLSPFGAGPASVEVELSRSDAARAELSRWSDQPRALYPRVSTRLTAPGQPLRLDVTAMARAARHGEPLRLLLRAEPGEGEAVLIATGAAGGQAPALEAYWE